MSDETKASAAQSSDGRPRNQGKHRSAAVIGVLTLLLGFAIVVQVRANSDEDALAALRQEDLIGILDNQNARAERLRQQISELQADLRNLQDTGDRAAAARQQAREQLVALGILLGTLPAEGPGVVVTITDPDAALAGEDLLAVVQELRGAGAEAIQLGRVRISASTYLQGEAGRVAVDGVAVRAPYRLRAIGDPKTLHTALNIPGGIAATVRAAGGELTVREVRKLRITATRTISSPKYATPSR